MCKALLEHPTIIKAIAFGSVKHAEQKDDMGKNYFQAHCFPVFKILSIVTQDIDILCAGLLHDTLEDTQTTYDELVSNFNQRIADLVNEVTNEGTADHYGKYFPRLRSKDAILIKFADRLSNLSRMEGWDYGRQNHYLRKSKFWKSDPPPVKSVIQKRELGTGL